MSKFEYVGEGDDGFGFGSLGVGARDGFLAKVANMETANIVEFLSGEVIDMSRNQIIARVNELATRDPMGVGATISEIIEFGNQKERANMEALKKLLA